MRKYYICILNRFPCKTPEAEWFYTKYNCYPFEASTLRSLLIKTSLFNSIYYSGLFAYSEDGRVFEFFSGTELGEYVESEYLSTSGDYPHTTIFQEIKSNIYGEFRCQEESLEMFAKKVEEYMPYKEKIKSVMEQYLKIQQSAYAQYRYDCEIKSIKNIQKQMKEEEAKKRLLSSIEKLCNEHK